MLGYELEASGSTTVVQLTGRLGIATVLDARTALHEALAGQPAAIVVDLSNATVADDIALTVLPAFARSAADWPGCPVLISATDPAIRRDLDRMAVSRVIRVHHELTAALAAAATIQAPRPYCRSLAPVAGSSTTARQLVTEACLAWDLDHLTDDAQLIATEMVSNAVRHVGEDMELMITRSEHFLHVSVRDRSPLPPTRILPDPGSGEGGHGLILLDAVASGWGTIAVADGKVVWATLRIRR